jgi:hypothetical protein
MSPLFQCLSVLGNFCWVKGHKMQGVFDRIPDKPLQSLENQLKRSKKASGIRTGYGRLWHRIWLQKQAGTCTSQAGPTLRHATVILVT